MTAPGSTVAAAAGRKGKDSTTIVPADDDACKPTSRYAAKRFRTLQAEAALAGCELLALAGGGFLLTKWSLARELRSIDDVARLLAQTGCRA